jgi:benzoate membrane transport protein
MRSSLWSAAMVAALVGYGGTIALVLAAAQAVGATPAQTASWLFAICMAKAIGSAGLSYFARVPVVLAWSTPGAALIAATSGITLSQAVGAFILSGLLTLLTGAVRPLERLVSAIPSGIAAGMLAGVLLPFCLKLPAAAQSLPIIVLPMICVFGIVRLVSPPFAVLAALGTSVAVAMTVGGTDLPDLFLTPPRLTFIWPEFDMTVLIGLGLPMYLVTMASQNLPGFTTLRAAGYAPPVRPALLTTGGLSAVSALFGAHPISMAAITAAICLGDDVHPDREQRWKVGVAYATAWVGLAVLGPLILIILAALPAALISAIVGLALLGSLTGALGNAFAPVQQRFAAAVTLVVTASGLAAFGVGAAFWGLLAGLAVHGLDRAAQARQP